MFAEEAQDRVVERRGILPVPGVPAIGQDDELGPRHMLLEQLEHGRRRVRIGWPARVPVRRARDVLMTGRRLSRELGLAGAIALVVGQVIAVGIFLTPGTIIRTVASPP